MGSWKDIVGAKIIVQVCVLVEHSFTWSVGCFVKRGRIQMNYALTHIWRVAGGRKVFIWIAV